jgi:hypothetical protein
VVKTGKRGREKAQKAQKPDRLLRLLRFLAAKRYQLRRPGFGQGVLNRGG